MYLILEDDVKMQTGWLRQARKALEDVPDDWGMLRLGMWGDTNPDDVVKEHSTWFAANRKSAGDWPVFKGYFGAHAIVLTPEKARQLMSVVKEHHGDYADRFTASTDRIKSYVSTANVVAQDTKLGSSRYDGWGPTPKSNGNGEKDVKESGQTPLAEANAAAES